MEDMAADKDLAVLLVEDDRTIAGLIALEFEHRGHHVSHAADGRSGLAMALGHDWDIILLDVMLPLLNGYEVCRQIRRQKSAPILLLTAKDEVQDKVYGLDLGADDYLTKPFEMEELMARIRAVLRRKNSQVQTGRRLKFRELELDSQSHQVYFGGQEIGLTKKEFELLTLFLEHPNHVLTRDVILEKVWGYDFSIETNIVDVYLRFLREKIDERFRVHYLHTLRGVGYVLRAEK